MKTLIYTSGLGIVCMLAEMFNLRKGVVPLAVVGLLAIFGITVLDINIINIQPSTFNNMLLNDSFGTAFSALLLFLGALLITLSTSFYANEESKIADYIAIIIFTIAGAIGLCTFGNMAMLFMGLEVMSISLYILAGSRKRDIRSNEAAMKYFLMGSFASGILLFGIALIYGETASFDLQGIASYVAANDTTIMFKVGVGMILVAMLFKVSAAPFHFWAPDVYEGSPMLITALMSTVAKIAAFAAFYRLFTTCFLVAIPTYAWILSAVAALTITVGNFTALNQDSFKRLLAFSGISHAGYLMLGIVSMYGKTDNAIFYYAVAYGISSVAAFAIAITVAKNVGNEKIDAFNGLGKSKPFLAAALTIAILSMAGIPPFAGFFGKYYIFSEAIKTGHLWLTIIAVLNSIVGVYYYFKVILAMYTKDSSESVISVSLAYSIVIILCTILTILIGIYPSGLANLL